MPIMPARVQVLVFILLGISGMIDSIVNRENRESLNGIAISVVILPFLFCILYFSSIIYSENFKDGLYVVEKKISLLIIPCILFIVRSRFSEKQVALVVLLFICSCVLLSIFLLFKVDFFEIQEKVIDIGLLQTATNIRHEFAFEANTHPTYLAIYFLFSCLMLSVLLLKKKFPKIINFVLIVAYGILVSISFLLASRMPLLAFVMCQSSMLIFNKKISVIKKISSVLVIVIILVLSFNLFPTFKHRIEEVIKTEIAPPVNENYNSTNLRVGITFCSIEVIKSNWLLGVGIGDSQYELNRCLYKFKTNAYKKSDYNSHNQYLSIWMDSGIVPFILFLLFILYLFIYAYKTSNPYLLSFNLFFSLCMLSENLLSRQSGILFFMFFYFVFCNFGKKRWH